MRWLGGAVYADLDVNQTRNINNGVDKREYSIEATVELFEGTFTVNIIVYELISQFLFFYSTMSTIIIYLSLFFLIYSTNTAPGV